MTIRNLAYFTAALVDWGFLDGCFGMTGIRVSDIDGMVERNGRVLILEAKTVGAKVPYGQGRALTVLASKPGITVLVIWGKKTEAGTFAIERMWEWGAPGPVDVSTDDVVGFVGSWFAEANQAGKAA